MRAFTIILVILFVGIGGAGAYLNRSGDGPNPFADGCSTESDKITTPENCAGGPDGKFVEMGKGSPDNYLQLDMGEGQEGTGNLTMHYNADNTVKVIVEFAKVENETIVSIDTEEVQLSKGQSTRFIAYEKVPTPYRYVRVYLSDERKFQLDAIEAETFRPDSDGDKMNDEYELQYGLNPLVRFGDDGPRGDLDQDLLTNIEEYNNNRLNPQSNDTDGDGLPDYWEVTNKLDGSNSKGNDGFDGDPDDDKLINGLEYQHGSNPQKPDSDKDGLADGEEVLTYSTDPTKDDTDQDKLGDAWEVKYIPAFDARTPNDANADPDGDGLINQDEFKADTSPLDMDSDDDCRSDLDEVNRSLKPNKWEDGDCDQDGLNNGDERDKYKTKVDNSDSDGDGLSDYWEVNNQFDPNISTGNDGPNGDPDLDGVTNLLEFQKSTHPYRTDSDEDSLPDSWEIYHCTDPNDKEGVNGPNGDKDGNGYTNFADMGVGTAPPATCP